MIYTIWGIYTNILYHCKNNKLSLPYIYLNALSVSNQRWTYNINGLKAIII